MHRTLHVYSDVNKQSPPPPMIYPSLLHLSLTEGRSRDMGRGQCQSIKILDFLRNLASRIESYLVSDRRNIPTNQNLFSVGHARRRRPYPVSLSNLGTLNDGYNSLQVKYLNNPVYMYISEPLDI